MSQPVIDIFRISSKSSDSSDSSDSSYFSDSSDSSDSSESIDSSPVSPVRLAHLWVDFRVIYEERKSSCDECHSKLKTTTT